MRSLRSGGSPYLVEPNGLVITNHRVLVTDGAKACVHEFEESGKYVGKFGSFTDLKYPAGDSVAKAILIVLIVFCFLRHCCQWTSCGGGRQGC